MENMETKLFALFAEREKVLRAIPVLKAQGRYRLMDIATIHAENLQVKIDGLYAYIQWSKGMEATR